MSVKSITFALMLCATVLSAQNPIPPMGVYIADPSARVAPDGRLYIYGSRDESPDYYCSDRYDVLSTKNVRKWRLDKDSFSWGTRLYAPDAAYKDGKTYLFVCTSDGKEIVARSNSPAGPFKDAVEIECPGQIDPAVFVDDDGQAYFFYSQFSSRVAKLNPDYKTLDLDSMVEGTVDEAGHGFHEGSFVFKRGQYYYYVYADISRKHRPTCLGYSMATSVLGPYTYKGIIIDNSGCDPEVWNNHGSVVEFNGHWYVLYHRATHGCVAMRKACIEEIHFNEDGTIDEVEMTTQGPGKPLSAFKAIDAARACWMSGHVRIEEPEDQPGREVLSQIEDGDTAVWKYIDFKKGARKASMKVRSEKGGRIYIYADSVDGEPLGSVEVPATATWKTVKTAVKKVPGVHALWVRFETADPDDLTPGLFQLDKIKF